LQKSCTICYVKRFCKLSYMYFFIFFAFFTPGKQPYFEITAISMMTTHSTPLVSARDHWWTLVNAFVSPGVNSRGELVPSHGASRRRLGDKHASGTKLRFSEKIFGFGSRVSFACWENHFRGFCLWQHILRILHGGAKIWLLSSSGENTSI
jgi:hypothetical protein